MDYLLHGAVQAAYVMVQQLEADVGDILNGDEIQAGLILFARWNLIEMDAGYKFGALNFYCQRFSLQLN